MRLPYALYVHGNSEMIGAIRAMESVDRPAAYRSTDLPGADSRRGIGTCPRRTWPGGCGGCSSRCTPPADPDPEAVGEPLVGATVTEIASTRVARSRADSFRQVPREACWEFGATTAASLMRD